MSYDPTLPTEKDRLRQIVGDVSIPELRTDDEYEAVLSSYPFTYAVVVICESLASQYAVLPDEYDEQGRIRVSWRNRGASWLEIAKRYRNEQTAPPANAPQRNPVEIGTLNVNQAGYRPHQNTRLSWNPWHEDC